jgi:hypothetical protein
MSSFETYLDEVLNGEDLLFENKQTAYSLYMRELARLTTAKNMNGMFKSIAIMIALSPHLDFNHARRIASK